MRGAAGNLAASEKKSKEKSPARVSFSIPLAPASNVAKSRLLCHGHEFNAPAAPPLLFVSPSLLSGLLVTQTRPS